MVEQVLCPSGVGLVGARLRAVRSGSWAFQAVDGGGGDDATKDRMRARAAPAGTKLAEAP